MFDTLLILSKKIYKNYNYVVIRGNRGKLRLNFQIFMQKLNICFDILINISQVTSKVQKSNSNGNVKAVLLKNAFLRQLQVENSA